MAAAAREADWQHVARLEVERRRVNGQLFANPIPRARREALAASLRQTMALDEELNRLALDARSDVAEDSRKLRENRRAMTAYHRHSTD